MTLKELKIKVLTMIEEYAPENGKLTEDPDIAAKFPSVTNQVMYELARFKKIPKYKEIQVSKGQLLDFAALEKEFGYEIYQVALVEGPMYILKGDGTVYKFLEDGTAEVDVYVYPERITEQTKDDYEFELSPDAMEILPYGVAGDLLKSDVSAEYGNVYANRYEQMLQRLDARYALGTITIEGGAAL